MGVLEKIMGLKKQGFSENEIISDLKEQGLPPKAIKESLDRAKIKNAVSEEIGDDYDEELEPSIMPMQKESPESFSEETSEWNEEFTPPRPSKTYSAKFSGRTAPSTYEISEEAPRPQEPFSSYPSYNQQQYAQEEYIPQEYEEEYPVQTGNIDSMIEISEQVFSEKIKVLQKQIEEIKEFKILISPEIDSLSDRLKRIESTIDALQMEILEKIGSYGTGIDSIKKEMSMMQNSFGKIVSTLADKTEQKNSRQTNNIESQTPKSQEQGRKRRKKQ